MVKDEEDWTPYKLAEDLYQGVPRSERAPQDVAAELLRVRDELREIVRLTRSEMKMAAAFRLGVLAKSMDIDLDPDVGVRPPPQMPIPGPGMPRRPG